MKWITFLHGVRALLLGEMTRTRRSWKDGYARRFKKGDMVEALDRQVKFGGRRLALLELTSDPYKASTAGMTDEDWYASGFHIMESEGEVIDGETPGQMWLRLKSEAPEDLWVLDFKVRGN